MTFHLNSLGSALTGLRMESSLRVAMMYGSTQACVRSQWDTSWWTPESRELMTIFAKAQTCSTWSSVSDLQICLSQQWLLGPDSAAKVSSQKPGVYH